MFALACSLRLKAELSLRPACLGRASKERGSVWIAAARQQLFHAFWMQERHLMRQLPLQVEAQPIVPQVPKEVHLGHVLPEEVLLVHVLPHLGDYSLAIAACFSRAWRRMAGEVRLRGSMQADACAA